MLQKRENQVSLKNVDIVHTKNPKGIIWAFSYNKASDFSFQIAFFKIAPTSKTKNIQVLIQLKHLNSAKTLLAAPK